MGVLTKPLLRATQRLDYEDWEVLLSSIQTDAKFWTKQFLSGSNYVLKGFSVTGFGLANATIVMADATLIMGANTENYSYYVAEVGASNLTVAASSLVANTRNYVELRLVEDDNTPASKVFWDQTANDGEGAEFSQLVDTVTDLAVEVVVSQVGFSGSGDRIPICILDLDAGGLIKGILDRRPMFFRLGTTSSADNDYSWVTQVEPPFSLVLSGGSGTYTAGEVVTFTSGTTATVVTGGTTNITVKLLSNINYSLGDTVVGASSGASRTLDGITESFTGADKSIGNFKDHLNAVMTQIKKIKGTRFWYEANSNSLEGLSYAINSCLVQNPSFTNVRFKWESGALSITDNSGSPANSDALAFLRIWGSSDVLTLTRQDAASAPLSISNGQILFIDLPEGANRTYSNAGSGATNYQTVALSSWTTTDSRYWIAYREGTKLYIRGYGELEEGEEAQIGDPLNANVLAYIGTDESSSEPDYNNEVAHDPRYIANNDSLTLAIANISKQLTEIYGQLQMKANDPVDTTINISSNLNTIKDNTQLNQFLDGRVLDFSGAVIDFDSGDVFEEDGSTPLGDNFTPASITNNHYFWYAITIVADSINANNTVKGKLLVTAASASAASLATAPRATFPTLGLHLGQVWVKKDNSGNLENITQANIVQLNIDAANLPDLTISPFSETITQNAHGFTNSDLGKQLYFDGTDWSLSDPNDPEKLRTHTLIEVVDTDTIRIQKIYKATIPSHGFTVGEYYYDDPVNVGNLTINYPLQGYISPAFYVRDADTIDIFSHTIPIDVHCAVAGGPAGMVSAINDLSDVDTATNPPSDGQVLVWDNGDANWVPGNMVASFATTANNPQTVATAGSTGDIIKSLSTNRYYVKKDNGTTTNWGKIVLDQEITQEIYATQGNPEYSALEMQETNSDFYTTDGGDYAGIGVTLDGTYGGGQVSVYGKLNLPVNEYTINFTTFDKNYVNHLVSFTPLANPDITEAELGNFFNIENASGADFTIDGVSGTTFNGNSTITLRDGKTYQFTMIDASSFAYKVKCIQNTVPYDVPFACGDETSDLTVGVITLQIPVTRDMDILSLKAFVSTAPVGDDIELDVLVNNVSILSAPLVITAGNQFSSAASLSTTALSEGDIIEVEVTQIGSSTAGAGLKLLFKGETELL